jgi:hypothetical protein
MLALSELLAWISYPRQQATGALAEAAKARLRQTTETAGGADILFLDGSLEANVHGGPDKAPMSRR